MQLVVEISEDTFFDLKKKQNRTGQRLITQYLTAHHLTR